MGLGRCTMNYSIKSARRKKIQLDPCLIQTHFQNGLMTLYENQDFLTIERKQRRIPLWYMAGGSVFKQNIRSPRNIRKKWSIW